MTTIVARLTFLLALVFTVKSSAAATSQSFEFILPGATPGEKAGSPLHLFLQVSDGRVTSAYGLDKRESLYAPVGLIHEVNAADLEIDSDSLRGPVAVTFYSQERYSAEPKSEKRVFTLDAKRGAHGWKGAWTSGKGSKGNLVGNALPTATVGEDMIVDLFMEFPVPGGRDPKTEVYRRSDYVFLHAHLQPQGDQHTGTFATGKITGGSESAKGVPLRPTVQGMIPMKPTSEGTIQGDRLTVTDTTIAGYLHFNWNLEARKATIEGEYRYAIKGTRVGGTIAGIYEVFDAAGEKVNFGPFQGWVAPKINEATPADLTPLEKGNASPELAAAANAEADTPIRPGVAGLEGILGISKDVKKEIRGKMRTVPVPASSELWRAYYTGSYIHNPAPAEGERRSPFAGPYFEPVDDIPSRVRAHARALRDSRYFLGVSLPMPAKYVSAGGKKSGPNLAHVGHGFVSNFLALYLTSDDAAEKAEALRLARSAIEYLAVKHGGTWNLPGSWYKTLSWIPLYAGEAYLDMFEITGDARAREAAGKVAAGIVRMQGDNGDFHWAGAAGPAGKTANAGQLGHPPRGSGGYMRSPEKDGKWGPYLVRKTVGAEDFLHFLGRYRVLTGDETYLNAERKAYQFVLDGNAKAMVWNYRSSFSNVFSPIRPTFFALYLMKYPAPGVQSDDERLALASDIARLIEDRSVFWDPAGPYVTSPSEASKFQGGKQVSAAARLAEVFALLGMETKNELATAKALALVNGILASQDPETGYIAWNYQPTPVVGGVYNFYHNLEGDAVLRILRIQERLTE